jgi:hypothetical protein
MPDLADQIRQFIDDGAPPLTIEEIAGARVRVWVGGQQDSTARRRPHRHTGWRLTVAGTAILLVAVGLAIVPSSRPARSETAAAAVLDQLAGKASQTAASVPGPGEYLYTQALEGTVSFSDPPSRESPIQRGWAYYIEGASEDWSAPTGPGRSVFYYTGGPLFMTAADRAAWLADGSQPIGVGWAYGPAVYYDVAGLPTKASRVKAYLTRQPGLGGDTEGNNPSWQFDTATEFLAAGASAKQRAALYQYMKSIHGVKDLGISRTVETHLSGVTLGLPGLAPGSEEEALFDPSTATILELRRVITGAATSHRWPGAQAGEAMEYDDFVYAGVANSTQNPPSGAPVLPEVWPAFTSRTPSPGEAYPSK